jgi:hypothetical protein
MHAHLLRGKWGGGAVEAGRRDHASLMFKQPLKVEKVRAHQGNYKGNHKGNHRGKTKETAPRLPTPLPMKRTGRRRTAGSLRATPAVTASAEHLGSGACLDETGRHVAATAWPRGSSNCRKRRRPETGREPKTGMPGQSSPPRWTRTSKTRVYPGCSEGVAPSLEAARDIYPGCSEGVGPSPRAARDSECPTRVEAHCGTVLYG